MKSYFSFCNSLNFIYIYKFQHSFALFMNKENSEDVKNKLFDRLVIVRTYILSEIRRVMKKKKCFIKTFN